VGNLVRGCLACMHGHQSGYSFNRDKRSALVLLLEERSTFGNS
jgi:hypothetical protein